MFLYGGLSPLTVSAILDISYADILMSKYTMAVEARGWDRKYAKGAKYIDYSTTMLYTDDMLDVVNGVAVRLKMS